MVWQLFRTFGGPITEAENPWQLVARSALFALLVGYAKPIFTILLDIARAPYTALMELAMTGEDFNPDYYVRYLKEKYGEIYRVR